MKRGYSTAIKQAAAALPQVLRDNALRQLDRLLALDAHPAIPDDLAENLLRLFACSEFGGNALLRDTAWFFEHRSAMQQAPDSAVLEKFAVAVAASDAPIDVVKQDLRRFRNRWFLHVLWRELAATSTLNESLEAISDLADQFLFAAAAYAQKTVQERFGVVRDEDGEPVSIVILGMGKLGGRELNFSSDIDVIFLYPGGADSDGEKSLSPAEYFTRISRVVVALIEEVTEDGFAFRVDTRLRPFGDSGPPVCSFAALESYLLQHGRGWERYAYVKARAVGPVPPARVAKDLYDNLITPFVYRRYLDYGVFESLREMRALIAAEVRRLDLADNIKLGPGGIREIEFIVQSLQLVRGGSRPDLQGRRLQSVMPRLTGRFGLDQGDAACLQSAYEFLRRLENFIQAIRDQQTHDLPADETDRARLATAMRFAGWPELREHLDLHREAVARQFNKIAFREPAPESTSAPRKRFSELWNGSQPIDEWARTLGEEHYADAAQLAELINNFRHATTQAGAEAGRRLQKFVPNLLAQLAGLDAPVPALQRVLAIAEQVLRRSAYLALLNENAPALEKLVGLCAQSAYVAGQIARYPVLLDELLDPRIYSERISPESLEADLLQQMASIDATDSELQMEVLGRFQRASQFRIALADFNGNLPIMRVSDCLTCLAEVVLKFALQVAWRDLTDAHGAPGSAGFGVVAYGKLGGLELSYGSDLDLVFLHDSPGAGHLTDGSKPLDHTVFYTRLVRRLVHFLTTQTGSGMLYEVDTRLRPDGQSGLLVTSLEAFERYQEENAWTWEHQALLRARPVAGSDRIAREFQRIRSATLSAGLHKETLRNDVISMRARMRKQLDKSNGQQFDLKQGQGGIGDIEFLVQYLVLANASGHASVFYYSDNIRQLDALAETGCLDTAAALKLQSIYRDYRLRVHHLLLDEQVALVAQDDFSGHREFVIAAWAEHLDEASDAHSG